MQKLGWTLKAEGFLPGDTEPYEYVFEWSHEIAPRYLTEENIAILRAHKDNPDFDFNNHLIAAGSTRSDTALTAELEAAWERWIRDVEEVDGRQRNLLRAAFEAGWLTGKAKD